jgi:hypothetical protein
MLNRIETARSSHAAAVKMQMMLATATLMVLLCGLGPTMASPRRHIDPQADFTAQQQQQEDQPQMTFINTDDYQSDDSNLALQVPIYHSS